jgi:hypothetical protein
MAPLLTVEPPAQVDEVDCQGALELIENIQALIVDFQSKVKGQAAAKSR